MDKQVVTTGKIRNEHVILIGKPEGKGPFIIIIIIIIIIISCCFQFWSIGHP
jgi:hypothetical protein